MIQLLNTLNKELINLEYWDYHRVDYSINFKFDTCEDKELFFLLVRKTSKRIRSQEKRVKGIPLKYQSVSEGNGSHKKLIYDKYDQIEKEYGREGFWIKVLTKDLMLYYADGYKDYIFYDEIGWEEFGFQPKLGHDIDYDKISEDEALEYVWEHQCNIKMFFVDRPWEK